MSEEKSEALAAYLRYLRMFTVHLKDGAYSAATIKEYTLDVQNFLASLHGLPVEDVTDFEIRDYLSQIRESGSNERTRNRKLSAIRTFFKVMMQRKIVTENPTTDIEGAKQEKNSIPVYLEDDELLAFLEKIPQGPYHARNMAIFMLMAYGGLRVSEVRGLNIENLNRGRNSINVLGKGNKWRRIPIAPSLMTLLLKIERERKTKSTHETALFLSRLGRRISVNQIQLICKEVYDALAKEEKFSYLRGKKFSCHKLRHTFGARNVRAGNDIRVIQVLMGHESLNTTQIYTHVADEQLEQAIANVPVVTPESVKKDKKQK